MPFLNYGRGEREDIAPMYEVVDKHWVKRYGGITIDDEESCKGPKDSDVNLSA